MKSIPSIKPARLAVSTRELSAKLATAKKRSQAAKAELKHVRKAYKQAKKIAKESRKEAKELKKQLGIARAVAAKARKSHAVRAATKRAPVKKRAGSPALPAGQTIAATAPVGQPPVPTVDPQPGVPAGEPVS